MGRIWFVDLRRELGALAGTVAGLVRGTGPGLTEPLHPVGEAAVTLAVIGAWTVLALVTIRRGPLGVLTLGGRLAPAWLLLALVGTAALMALAVATLAPALAGPPLLAVATVVAVIVAAGVAWWGTRGGAQGGAQGRAQGRAQGGEPGDLASDAPGGAPDDEPGGLPDHGDTRRQSDPNVRPEPGSPGRAGRLIRLGVALVAAAALGLLGFALALDAVHLAFYRPAAIGDEVSFWWSATEVLHQVGWDRYLATFYSAGYAPGYPLVANVLLGWLPDGLFFAAGRALPFLYGFLALALLTRGLAGRGARDLLGPTAALVCVVGYVLLFQGDWIHSMFFELWYGEAFATVLTILLFVLLDHARRSASATRRVPALALLGVGLGVLAAISKPPLSFLLLPAIVPTLLVAGVVLRPAGRSLRPYLVALAAVAAGALAANQLWGAQLKAHEIGAYYSLDLGSLLAFHPEGSFGPLVRYFFGEYQPTWVGFLLVAALAAVHDPRRYLPFLLVGTGMAVSIFVLYLGVWSVVEHESGARYILHGVDGFTIFALGALTPAIRTILDGWLAGIAGLVARLAARRRAPEPTTARPGVGP